MEKDIQNPCCIMFANDKIVIALEEPRKCTYKLLSKASIKDLVSILIDPIASNFVMLVSTLLSYFENLKLSSLNMRNNIFLSFMFFIDIFHYYCVLSLKN